MIIRYTNNFVFNGILILLLIFSYFGMISMQSAFDASGGGNRTLLAMITMVIELFMLMVYLLYFKSAYFSKFHYLILFWIFLVLISAVITGTDIDRIFKNIVYTLFWPLSFLFWSLITRKYFNGVKTGVQIFAVLFAFCLLMYFYILQLKSSILLTLQGSNQVYYPFLILPWLLLLKNKKWRHILLAILFLAVLSSFKRNTIALYVVIVAFYLKETYFKDLNVFGALFKILLMLSIPIAILFNRIQETKQFEFLMNRFLFLNVEKETGRKAIWGKVIGMQKDSTLLEWLVGHGHNSVVLHNNINGQWLSAHNDFIEVMYDYGAIVFILYICLLYFLIRRALYLRRINSRYYISHVVSLVIFFGMSLVSHLILYPTYFIFLVAFWAVVDAQIHLFSKDKKITAI